MGIKRLSLEGARERNLKALGKSTEWYDSKFKEQNGTCAICHRPQTQIGLDGELRPLVANVAGDCLLCRKCSARQNKQNQRQRDSEYKKLKAKRAAGPQQTQEFWRKNRNGLSEADKVAHETRDTEIINHICSANAWMSEENLDDEGRECFRESAREICEEIQRNGTVETVIPDWQDESTKCFQSVADSVYFQFGSYQALPADLASRFIEFAERELNISVYPYGAYGGYGYRDKRIARILAVLDGETYVDPDLTARCSTPGCRETTTIPPMVTKFVPRDDAGNFMLVNENIPSAQRWCPTCQAERDKAAHAAVIRIRERQAQLATTAPTRGDRERETIFDDTGRYGG